MTSLLSSEDQDFIEEMQASFGDTRGQYKGLLECVAELQAGKALGPRESAFVAEFERQYKDRPASTFMRFVRIIRTLQRSDLEARIIRLEQRCERLEARLARAGVAAEDS